MHHLLASHQFEFALDSTLQSLGEGKVGELKEEHHDKKFIREELLARSEFGELTRFYCTQLASLLYPKLKTAAKRVH